MTRYTLTPLFTLELHSPCTITKAALYQDVLFQSNETKHTLKTSQMPRYSDPVCLTNLLVRTYRRRMTVSGSVKVSTLQYACEAWVHRKYTTVTDILHDTERQCAPASQLYFLFFDRFAPDREGCTTSISPRAATWTDLRHVTMTLYAAV